MSLNPYNQDQLSFHDEYDQELTNGGTFHISSYLSGEFPVLNVGRDYYYSTSPGINNPSTVADLTPFVNDAIKKGSISNEDVSYVFNNVFDSPQPEEYYQTDEYTEKKELVESKIVYIWGSSEDGGLFCYISSNNNKPTFRLLNGYAQRYISDELYYGSFINFVGSFGSEFDLSKVVFYIDAVTEALDVYGNQLFVRMLVGGDNCVLNIANWEWNLLVQANPYYELTAAATDFKRIDDLPAIWTSVLVDSVNFEDPQAIWSLTGLYNDVQLWDTLADQSIITMISGTPTGGKRIDDETNPYSDGGFSTPGGGGASLDNQVDTNNPEDDSAGNITTDGVTAGICRIYNPTSSELLSFNSFLYSGITDSIADTLKKLTTDPLQYIISLGMVHFNPPTSVNAEIMMGSVDTGVTARRVNRQYTSLDFGYIDFNQEFKSFLDFNPYSKISVFLPYIGQRELNMDECRGSRLRLYYNIDMITGSCIAYIHISRSARSNADCSIFHTMYSFEGNCLTQIPMFATDNRGAIQSLLSVAGAGVSLATGNVAGAVTGLVNGVTTQKISVGRAGSLSSNYGYISPQRPYIIAERPIVNVPINFGGFEGWTSNIRRQVSQLKGYTEIDPDTIWTDNFGHATDEEAQMIKDIMNGGVYL